VKAAPEAKEARAEREGSAATAARAERSAPGEAEAKAAPEAAWVGSGAPAVAWAIAPTE
jgi:hypothetical protein